LSSSATEFSGISTVMAAFARRRTALLCTPVAAQPRFLARLLGCKLKTPAAALFCQNGLFTSEKFTMAGASPAVTEYRKVRSRAGR
jgi:hypothetical protein